MAIIVDKVTYVYGEGTPEKHYALKNINLKIEDGEFIGLVGHTGSGKSTLVQHLNGLLVPTYGNIYYNGVDIHDGMNKRELRSKIGLVFQYPEYQLFETTVIKDVSFGPKNMGLSNLEVDVRSFEALKQVGIGEELLDASPMELSGGQKRKVAIAGILAMHPEVMILDEPAAGLDPRGKEEILELIYHIHKEKNSTIIMISHSMDDVAKYAGRMIVMDGGEIKLDGKPEKIFQFEKELQQMGLAVPQVTQVLNTLKKDGFLVNTNAFTIEDAKKNILDALNDKSNNRSFSDMPVRR